MHLPCVFSGTWVQTSVFSPRAFRVLCLLVLVHRRVPQPTEDACYGRRHGAAVHLAVRVFDVHHHLVDSCRRADGVLRFISIMP